MTTQQTINATKLRRLLAEATPGPWKQEGVRVSAPNVLSVCMCNASGQDPLANSTLIAAAVNALPDLLAERERLREALRLILASASNDCTNLAGQLLEIRVEAKNALAETEPTK